MTQQKSERGAVPQGRRKTVPTDAPGRRGGKAAPVDQQTVQLCLRFGTAEHPATPVAGAVDGAEVDPSAPAPLAVPKPKRNPKIAPSATMEGTHRPGAAHAGAGIGEVVNRPAGGVTTSGPEEPDVKSTCPVP